jgi:hypothetical protein
MAGNKHYNPTIWMTKEEKECVLKYLADNNIGIGEAGRKGFILLIPDFPNNMPERGKYERKTKNNK